MPIESSAQAASSPLLRCASRRLAAAIGAALLGAVALAAQTLSGVPARILGQPDLQQFGLNGVRGEELRSPDGLALDERASPIRLYVGDSANNRVLGWANATSFANGAPADLVLGQPNFRSTGARGIGNGGLTAPTSLAVHPATGDLYVSDTGSNRILRFADPFANPSVVEPNKVYGQQSFAGSAPNQGGISARVLRGPTGLRFDAAGNLWICDAGNHRVLRYPAATLDSEQPEADLVLGQTSFTGVAINASGGQTPSASGFNQPVSLAFHPNGSLYVADALNTRVLVFTPPFATGAAASRVIGQPDFVSRAVPFTIEANFMRGPNAVFVGANGTLYVAVQAENRVLVFENVAAAGPHPPANRAIGQILLTSDFPNVESFPRASARGLFGPADVVADRGGELFVSDAGNNRVTAYSGGSPTATRVLGQSDFESNGPNRVDASSLALPLGAAIDYSDAQMPLYVADTSNHRVLIWNSSLRFADGAPADRVIGQPNLTLALANSDTGRGQSPTATSLASPRGLWIEPNGDLWVADQGNNRVLRYRKPVEQAGRIRADLVLGQPGFTSSTSAAVTASSLRSPWGVAAGPDGSIFVGDTGNNRVLEYAPNPGNGAAARRVYGQRDFVSGADAGVSSPQTLSTPTGIHVDDSGFLYVADTGAHRVLLFPLSADAPEAGSLASFVLGQESFTGRGSGSAVTQFNTPVGVSTGPIGDIFVADSNNRRTATFPGVFFLPPAGATPSSFLGQGATTPTGVYVDRNGTLYVSDATGSRLLHFLGPAAAVGAATFDASAGIAPGSLASLFGVGFSTEGGTAASAPLPRELGGRYVEFAGDVRAPLLFVSPGQINFQAPVEAQPGNRSVFVRRADTDEPVAGGPVVVSTAGPGIFTTSQDGRGAALALNQDGTVNGPSNPAARGSVVTFFGTGQGRTNPAVASGEAAPGGPLSTTVARPTNSQVECVREGFVCAVVGSKIAEVQFSGLAPGFVGLWQLNVKMPEGDDVNIGDAVPVRVILDRRTSNVVTISLR